MQGIDMAKQIQMIGIMVLCCMMSACGTAPPTTYDLLAPPAMAALKPLPISLVISEPSASRAFDTENVIVRASDGAISYVPDVQWSDRAPVIVQTRLLRAIENKGYSVTRDGAGVLADRQLATEIAAFNLVPGKPMRVEIVLTLRLIDTHEGKLLKSRSFESQADVASLGGPDVAAGFDHAISDLMPSIAEWIIAPRL
jgi:cholesterol transport system auxiliary component